MKNRHPIYIVSKGRWEQRITARALDAMNVNYYVVVEKAEYDNYAKYFSPSQLLVLPQNYLDEYDTFWPREEDNKTGHGAARNFAWDHSISIGATYHWVLDDNIEAFYRMNRNEKPRTTTGAIFAAAEDFVERYENVPLAGFNYHSYGIDPIKLKQGSAKKVWVVENGISWQSEIRILCKKKSNQKQYNKNTIKE